MIDYLYVDSPITLDQKMADWENKFFHPLKGDDTRRHNIILQAAESYFIPEARASAGEQNKERSPLSPPCSTSSSEPTTPYHHKSSQAAIRSMLYSIARSLHQDMQHQTNQKITQVKSRLKKKRIHHQTIEERREQSHDR